jgi:hypothetical protein
LNGEVGNPEKVSAADARHECRSQKEKRSGHHCKPLSESRFLRKVGDGAKLKMPWFVIIERKRSPVNRNPAAGKGFKN